MARENQGLQIALIIFVMLTVVLGVTTFIFFQKCDEANKKAADNEQVAKEARENEETAKKNFSTLRTYIGLPDSAKVDAIGDRFKKDMTTYAANFPEEAQSYSAVLPYLYKVIDEKLGDLETSKVSIQKWKDDYSVVQANAKPQVVNAENAAKAAKEDLAKVNADYKARRTAYLGEQQQLRAQFSKVRKEATMQAARAEEQLQDTNNRLQKLAQINQARSDQLRQFRDETFEVPDGEIRWVNQHNGTVWINRGRADSLQRQTTFSVYPRDTSNLTGGGKKASIEVTQILGPHTAEARIVEDSMTNPVMPGDKIHTPIWSRGEQRRFALAGLMDLDGNGKSDQHIVRNLITMNGGVIDSYMDETGKPRGKMTVDTRYLVLGKAPDERSTPAQRNGYTAMIGESNELNIEQISLGELLNQMGWKNQSPVTRFGRGGTPVRLKPPEGVPRVSTGTVSELFRNQNAPPAKPVGRGGAY